MSENVGSSGFFAVLKNPITDKKEREEKEEILYDSDTDLELNYEGTLIFSDKRSDGYGINIGSINEHDKKEFIDNCKKEGIEIDEESIQPYSCYWYNGADSYMSELTLEEYLKKIR